MAAKEKIHPVPPIITPLLVIPLPKSSSADLDEPIPFLLVQCPETRNERKGKLLGGQDRGGLLLFTGSKIFGYLGINCRRQHL